MLLCDAAQSVGGKLFILGAGWSQILVPDQPVNMALAVKLSIPWDQANDPHRVKAQLVDGDGNAVLVPIEGDEAPVENEVVVETGRPPGLAPGTELDAPLAFNFGGLALPAGQYRWELWVDGNLEARAPFRVGQVQRRR
jgi:hypothetical protein